MCIILDITSCLDRLNMEKAFHSLDHGFLWSVLKKFGFGKISYTG